MENISYLWHGEFIRGKREGERKYGENKEWRLKETVKAGKDRRKRERFIGNRGGKYIIDSDEIAMILVQIVRLS